MSVVFRVKNGTNALKPWTISLVLIVLICSIAVPASAQSPYEIGWPKDGFIAGGSLLALAIGFSVDSKITPLTEEEIAQLSKDDVNPFDRPATENYSVQAEHASDVVVWTCLSLPITFVFSERIRHDAATVAVMYAEAMILSNGVTQIVKGTVQRIRPFVYNSAAPLEKKTESDARKSFYSSHTSNAFASAVFFATVFGDYFPNSRWKPYVWGGSLLVAASAGYLRIEAGMHFPTDVLVGAGVGAATGFLLPRWHRRGDQHLNIAPVYRFGELQINMKYTF
jgi:membrane-associated phospholipid phosphatase